MYMDYVYSLFTNILSMSLVASIVIIVLLSLRPMLKKFPRIFLIYFGELCCFVCFAR